MLHGTPKGDAGGEDAPIVETAKKGDSRMSSTKIRKTVIAIVASLSVAGLAVVPTAAEAMPMKLVLKKMPVTVCVQNPLTGVQYCQTR